jgi:hypothetical protein
MRLILVRRGSIGIPPIPSLSAPSLLDCPCCAHNHIFAALCSSQRLSPLPLPCPCTLLFPSTLALHHPRPSPTKKTPDRTAARACRPLRLANLSIKARGPAVDKEVCGAERLYSLAAESLPLAPKSSPKCLPGDRKTGKVTCLVPFSASPLCSPFGAVVPTLCQGRGGRPEHPPPTLMA